MRLVGSLGVRSIGIVTLAMREGIGLGDLAALVHPYPTRAQILGRIADAYRRSRLGGRTRAALDRWFAWRR